MRLGLVVCATVWLAVAALAQAAAAGSAAIADQVQQAAHGLQAAVEGLDAGNLRLKASQQQVLADSQASLQRNLSDAVPGLLAAYRAAPGNLGAAFRLYRDLEAVLAVAQRSADAWSSGDGAEGGAALRASADQLRASLDQFGDWMEAAGSANYAQLQSLRAPATPPAPAAPAPPQTLVINNANGAAQPAAKKAAAKIPHD